MRRASSRTRSAASTRTRRRTDDIAFGPGSVAALDAVDTSGNRYRLVVGEASGIVSVEIIGSLGLRIGRELDAPVAERLTTLARQLHVFDRAVGLLAVKSRSARELTIALRRRQYDSRDAEQAVAKLIELGLVDDARYANAVANQKASQGTTRRHLTRVLRQRGVSSELADRAIRDAFPEGSVDEKERAIEVARRRMRSLKGLDPAVAKRRLYAFLVRRGYEPATCTAAVRVALDSSDEDNA